MTISVYLLLVLSVAWAARLVTDFSIALPFRMWVVRKYGETSKPAVLVHCIWCTGFWVSVLFVLASYPFLWYPIWQVPLMVLSIAFLAPAANVVVDRLVGGS